VWLSDDVTGGSWQTGGMVMVGRRRGSCVGRRGCYRRETATTDDACMRSSGEPDADQREGRGSLLSQLTLEGDTRGLGTADSRR